MKKKSGQTKKKTNRKSLWGKKKVFIIETPPYRYHCVVVLNGQFEDSIPVLKKHFASSVIEYIGSHPELYDDDYTICSGSGRLYTSIPGVYVMLISHEHDWRDSVGVISHETVHLASCVLRNAGIEHTEHTEEAYTYLQQKLLTTILYKMYP